MKEVDSKKLDATLLKQVEEAVAGQGDGRISEAEAKHILKTLEDGSESHPLDTLTYIRANFKFTPKAKDYFDKHPFNNVNSKKMVEYTGAGQADPTDVKWLNEPTTSDIGKQVALVAAGSIPGGAFISAFINVFWPKDNKDTTQNFWNAEFDLSLIHI